MGTIWAVFKRVVHAESGGGRSGSRGRTQQQLNQSEQTKDAESFEDASLVQRLINRRQAKNVPVNDEGRNFYKAADALAVSLPPLPLATLHGRAAFVWLFEAANDYLFCLACSLHGSLGLMLQSLGLEEVTARYRPRVAKSPFWPASTARHVVRHIVPIVLSMSRMLS